MNGEVCCILGVCCPAGSDAQAAALATAMANGLTIPAADARVYADWVLANFDLGPKGAVTPMLIAGANLKKHA